MYGVLKCDEYKFINGNTICEPMVPLSSYNLEKQYPICVSKCLKTVCIFEGMAKSVYYYTSFPFRSVLQYALSAIFPNESCNINDFLLKDDAVVYDLDSFVPLNGYPPGKCFFVVRNDPSTKASKEPEEVKPATLSVEVRYKKSKRVFSFPETTTLKTLVSKISGVHSFHFADG